MNRQLLCSAIASVLITTGVFAQKKSKTFKEVFNVGDNTIININTNHTDIEFETWDKNQVEVNAVIEIEGATKEEVERYFKNELISIKGNSKEIDITTNSQKGIFAYSNYGSNRYSNIDFDVKSMFEDLKFPEPSELSELTDELLDLKEEFSELAELMVIPELPIIPSLPELSNVSFDYEAYKKNGDKYLKKWRKEFEKNFNNDSKENFKEWAKEFEKLNKERLSQLRESRKLAYEKRRSKLLQERETREKVREVIRRKTQEKSALKRKQIEQRKNALLARRDSQIVKQDSIYFVFQDSIQFSKPRTFYISSDKHEKYKVKKTIKVKLPKSVKLKMNVRHGEVKLASTTKNIEASLEHASLLAVTIEGNATNIKASYSPITVQKWKYGQLKTNYSDNVNLKEVGELSLNSVSSKVRINKLNKSILLANNLGEILIDFVNPDFKYIDVTIKNGEFYCNSPKTPLSVYMNTLKSQIEYPTNWTLEQSQNDNTIVYKGYQIKANSNKSIRLDAKYSKVVFKN